MFTLFRLLCTTLPPCKLARSFSTGATARTGALQKKLGIAHIDHIIAVMSAKGGVGKSTTAVNLAVALATLNNLRVGLLDADIHGASIPRMMNLSGRPAAGAGPQPLMVPKENYRVKCMSFGFFLEADQAVIWRGPMINQAFDKMLFGSDWGDLNVLVVDMPPGTGDAQINLCQRVPLSGAIVVSTPQEVAVRVAARGIEMLQKLKVPVLGLVENMSYHMCSSCGQQQHIFGKGGVQLLAQKAGVPLLAQVPLDMAIQEHGDAGTPVVISQAGSEQATVYATLAGRVHQLLGNIKQQTTLGPQIVVE